MTSTKSTINSPELGVHVRAPIDNSNNQHTRKKSLGAMSLNLPHDLVEANRRPQFLLYNYLGDHKKNIGGE